MPFNLTIKKSLQEKTAKRRKELKERVSRGAVAASCARNDLLPEMKLELRKIASLKKANRRVRKTAPEQLSRVMRVIGAMGQSAPILIDGAGQIINGHIVVEAMKKLGQTLVWCAVIEHLSDEEKDLFHVALNHIGETGEWDEHLGPLLVDLGNAGYDLTLTGFSLPQIDILTLPPIGAEHGEAGAELIPTRPISPVSRLGDYWRLHAHRLLCADSTREESYAQLLEGEMVDAVFADSPYNIPIEGFVSGLGKKKHKNFAMGVGEMPPEQFAQLQDTHTKLCADRLVPGGILYSCIDWRSIEIVLAAGQNAGLRRVGMAVWDKGTGAMGSYLRSAYELIPIFCKGDKLAVNNVELGRHGRNRTNVWSYPGANTPGS